MIIKGKVFFFFSDISCHDAMEYRSISFTLIQTNTSPIEDKRYLLSINDISTQLYKTFPHSRHYHHCRRQFCAPSKVCHRVASSVTAGETKKPTTDHYAIKGIVSNLSLKEHKQSVTQLRY